MLLTKLKDKVMNLQKLDNCYRDAMEISDLFEILNIYLENYQDEIPIASKIITLTNLIHHKNENIVDNLDDIVSEENFKKHGW